LERTISLSFWPTTKRGLAGAVAVLLLGAAPGCATRAAPGAPFWLVSVPAAKPAPDAPLIIWISGDGGWGRMEKEMTRRFAAAGVETIGVDSLRYFWRERKPEVVAREIATLVARADTEKRRMVIAGFSFGADIAPFVVQAMAPDLRKRVTLTALLSPSRKVSLRVSPASWLGIGFGARVEPVMNALGPTPVLCIGGAGVFADICPEPSAASPGVTSFRLTADHELHGQYDLMARLILDHAGLTP
jgi:type IV secretory pathway VirJ component